jgi:lactoylglutathione lyase
MKLDHITVSVSSYDVSMPYYAALLSLLGFKKLRDFVWSDGHGFYFQFAEAREGTRPYERYGAGMNHLGFGVESEAEVVRVRDAMQAAGFPVPKIQTLSGSKALFMKDNDGIRFEVTYYAPGSSVVN